MVELTVRRAVLLFIGLWLFGLLWGRLSMFAEVWTQEGAQAKEFIATNKRCVGDHDFLHDAPTTCMRAMIEKDRWPLLRAIGIVFERSYLCGSAPCTDLLRAILESWSALAVIIAVSVTGTCIVCSGLFKRVEQGYYGPQQPRYQENAYGVNGPAVMIGHDHVPIELDYTPAWRDRFAGYVPLLGNRQHEKLI